MGDGQDLRDRSWTTCTIWPTPSSTPTTSSPPTGRFHRALNLASGSPRLLTYLRQAVRVVPASYFELFPEQVRRSRAEHAALLEAIGRGDAVTARALTESHVLEAGAALGDWLRARTAEAEPEAPGA